VQHRISTRAPDEARSPLVRTDAAAVASFLDDAAHVAGGWARGVACPRDEAETAGLVRAPTRLLAVGAQSSLTGGATPRGGIVLSTRSLDGMGTPRDGVVSVGAGVPISTLQRHLSTFGLWYPPAPTFDGAFVGGVIATNAAGPATFKYGSTRPWVAALTAVLASGEALDVVRGRTAAPPGAWFEIDTPRGGTIRVPVPGYAPPAVAKLSAGYHVSRPQTDLIDLFIGSEGTLGVITAATLRVVPLPPRALVLLTCRDDAQAVSVTRALRDEAAAAWAGRGPLDVAAVEYIDARSLDLLDAAELARAGVARPDSPGSLLLVQIELTRDEAMTFERLDAVLESAGVDVDPRIALPGDERGARQLYALRESVPAAVNAAVAAAKTRAHPDIEKTAGDMVVPFDRVLESIHVYRAAFERRGLEYAIWGHMSDGNLHPNVIPRSLEDVERGREALLEIAQRVVAMGGAPLAEHGVGRNALKQRLLRDIYGEEGIEQMRAVKRALDPDWKLAEGVLFPPAARAES
jgi:D-lactate dehydrogenase (cytochrome)